MIQIRKVMARRDAYSVLLAIVVAGLLSAPLRTWSDDIGYHIMQPISDPVTGASFASPLAKAGLSEVYARPLLVLVIGLLLVELILWIVVFLNDQMTPVSKTRK